MPLKAYSRVQSLAAGARVALVAPSGPLRGERDVEQSVTNARAFGWEPVVGAHALARDGYLAGSDAQRLHDLNAALRDDTIDAVWCIRGGYGATRILDDVAYDALRAHPKPVIGYSDVTALHAAIGRECHLVTYHGPTARAEITPFSRNSFERALVFREDPCGTAHGARTLRGGRATGRLAGGNLALVAALAGTRYFPDLAGAILVLEDVNEPVYRVDRMLRQIVMTGALSDLAAIAFGQCTECPPDETPDGAPPGFVPRTLDDVLRETANVLNVPCVTALPFGHVDDQWTLPLGAVATLDADALTLTVEEM